ncbi:MAG: hypothetical protein LBH28_06730 [Oscillospiraceae bacterium]|jgi:hypothetical protein|nr:hypothetical protein [Oscillospiraceae bacterium]
MSIKGIDSQIMITRAADLARDSSALQKKPELTQEYLAIQAKANEAQVQKRVSRKTEVEMQKLRPDKDGGGSGGGGGNASGDRSSERKNELDSDTLVPPGNNVIDIKV